MFTSPFTAHQHTRGTHNTLVVDADGALALALGHDLESAARGVMIPAGAGYGPPCVLEVRPKQPGKLRSSRTASGKIEIKMVKPRIPKNATGKIEMKAVNLTASSYQNFAVGG